MTDKVTRYDCLIDTLYRFACGPWPPMGQDFKWRTRDEIEQALKWIVQLEDKHEQEEMDIRDERYRRRKAKASSVVKLVPPA
jgi:hypothetical protein